MLDPQRIPARGAGWQKTVPFALAEVSLGGIATTPADSVHALGSDYQARKVCGIVMATPARSSRRPEADLCAITG